jgi:hypothetical protein
MVLWALREILPIISNACCQPVARFIVDGRVVLLGAVPVGVKVTLDAEQGILDIMQ